MSINRRVSIYLLLVGRDENSFRSSTIWHRRQHTIFSSWFIPLKLLRVTTATVQIKHFMLFFTVVFTLYKTPVSLVVESYRLRGTAYAHVCRK